MKYRILITTTMAAGVLAFGTAGAQAACPAGSTAIAAAPYCTTPPPPPPGNTTPPPPGDTTPPPAEKAPKTVVASTAKTTAKALKGKKASKALVAGKTVTVKLAKSEPGTYKITAKVKGHKKALISGTVRVKKFGTAKLKVKLTKAGKAYIKTLKRRGKKSVTFTQTVSFKGTSGKTVKKTSKIKIKI